MTKCSFCKTTIFFGGVRDGDRRYCNQKCQTEGEIVIVADLIPQEDINQRVTEIHQGLCPRCKRSGPVDVHTSHSVWSALIVTSSKSSPRVSCTPCGRKAKALSAVGAMLFGWWGFPWGLVLTPIQISKNVWGLLAGRSSFSPSPELERVARLTYAQELRAMNAAVPPLTQGK